MSTLRVRMKIPKYILFYFSSDKTSSILPSSNIITVIKGDKKSKGSIVKVQYGQLRLDGEIVDGGGMLILDQSCL